MSKGIMKQRQKGWCGVCKADSENWKVMSEICKREANRDKNVPCLYPAFFKPTNIISESISPCP
jgi:hypothetical protein